MPTEIIMPKVDMVMESGTFIEWLKKEGETVRKGDPLFVMMTDKSAIECEAPASGVLVGVRAKPDDVIPVTQVIGYIQAPGELFAPAKPDPTVPAAVGRDPKGFGNPAGLVEPQTHQVTAVQDKLLRATPLARTLARDMGLDLLKVKGCGPGGRIYKSDVLAAAEAARAETATALAVVQPPSLGQLPDTTAQLPFTDYQLPISETPKTATGPALRLPDAGIRDRVPLKGIRAITAQRLAYSASTSPHIYLSLNVDMSEVLRWREKVGSGERARPSLTAVIAFVVAHLLPAHPYLNSSLAENEIILWKDVHLGIATALEDDLLVPVVRSANGLSLDATVKEMNRLLAAARERKLMPAELNGSTFTISNLGMFGIEDFTAILNPPEAAILGVGKMVETPVVVDEQVTVRPLIHLTLGTDHRVNDGLRGARFLSDLKNVLENPYLLL